jgi:hypothetical protein
MHVPSPVPPGCPRVFPGRDMPLQQYCRFPLEEARAKLSASRSTGIPGCSPVGYGGFLWKRGHCRRCCRRTGKPGVPRCSPGVPRWSTEGSCGGAGTVVAAVIVQ